MRSKIVYTQDGSQWIIEIRPKSLDKFSMNVVIHAVETPAEIATNSLHRKLVVKPIIHKHLNLETGEANPSELAGFEAFFTNNAEDESGMYAERNLTPYALKYATAET